MFITKSLFVDYYNHPKLARWKVNNKATYKKIRKIESQEQEDAIIRLGQTVEDTVQSYFEQRLGVKALDMMPAFSQAKQKNEEEPDDDDVLIQYSDKENAQRRTLEAIKNQIPLIYQPTFLYNDCAVRADFMVWNGANYDLYEVKAKSTIRKTIKDDGVDKAIGAVEESLLADMSFQYYVINHSLAAHQLGQIGSCFFVYLNKQYIKDGKLDLQQLIAIDEVNQEREIEIVQRGKFLTKVIDDRLREDGRIQTMIDAIRAFISYDEPTANAKLPRDGKKYTTYFGKDREFGTIMGAGISYSEKNAEHISNLYAEDKIKLTELDEHDIGAFNDGTQAFIYKYLRCLKQQQPLIKTEELRNILNGLNYPICFYDYETINVPIPFLDKTRPYMHTVVQYSLHKYYEDGTMKHYGAIYQGEGTYRVEQITLPDHANKVQFESEKIITGTYQDLITELIADIGDDIHHSSFVVWHEPFEKGRNNEIAQLFPKFADAMHCINEQTYDLKRIVSDGYYFDLDCEGSASIKKVLPVLVPEMSYADLPIGKGDKAMQALHQLITQEYDHQQARTIIEQLLIYCGQDSLAMVRIFEAMRKLIN